MSGRALFREVLFFEVINVIEFLIRTGLAISLISGGITVGAGRAVDGDTDTKIWLGDMLLLIEDEGDLLDEADGEKEVEEL